MDGIRCKHPIYLLCDQCPEVDSCKSSTRVKSEGTKLLAPVECKGCGTQIESGDLCEQCSLESCISYWLDGCGQCAYPDCKNYPKDKYEGPDEETRRNAAALAGIYGPDE